MIAVLRERGLLRTEGKTPQNTLAAQMYTEIKRSEARGEECVFTCPKPGHFALAGRWAVGKR